MGEKTKGRDAGKAKKTKATKVGHRPHEERQRQDELAQALPASMKGSARPPANA